jgi:glutathione S-transferase
MVELAASDVLTKEVLDWQGLHLFHFSGSSCSQKLRIYLRLKNIPVTLRPTNLLKHENETDWYMGINPRGLVPTLIDDGKVIIESNDIITHLENKFPTPSLIPEGCQSEVEEMLKFEDDLHMDFRTLTLRFFVPSAIVQRSDEQLTHYTEAGSGQVQGEVDTHKADETAFWQDMKDHRGVPEFRTKAAVTAMREAFENYETQLAKHAYLLGDALSVLDIAWYVYANRLVNMGYPLATLHPHVTAWFADIHKRPDFYKEVATPLPLRVISRGLQTVHRLKGKHIGAYLR